MAENLETYYRRSVESLSPQEESLVQEFVNVHYDTDHARFFREAVDSIPVQETGENFRKISTYSVGSIEKLMKEIAERENRTISFSYSNWEDYRQVMGEVLAKMESLSPDERFYRQAKGAYRGSEFGAEDMDIMRVFLDESTGPS